MVINESLAARLFPDSNPVGQRIAFTDTPTERTAWWRIVGVVGDERQGGPREAPHPEVINDLDFDTPQTFRFVVRGSAAPLGMVGPIRAVLKDIRPNLPMDEIAAMDAVVAKTLVDERFLLWIAGAFAVLATLLAVGGVYGVTVAATDRWKREMGIRLALGAAPVTLFATVLRRGAAVVAWGLLAGGLGSLVVHRFVGALLFQTSSTDPIAILAVLTLLATGGVLASLPAAFRAMRTSPAAALTS